MDDLPLCYFSDGCEIQSARMVPPPVGSLLFFEGRDNAWRVVDLQFQWGYVQTPGGRVQRLKLVNVILEPSDERRR